MSKKQELEEAIAEEQSDLKPKKKKRVNVRQKGHNLERDLVLVFKALGFDKCKTSRNASKLLDDSKVDLANVPINIQAKMGYLNNRPKADVIFQEMAAHLEANFMPGDPQITYPKALFHKIDGKKKENYLVTMMFHEWMDIYKDYLEYQKLKQKQ